MGGIDPGSAREEAERLVATVLATARLAASGDAAGRAGDMLGQLGEAVSGLLRPPHQSGSGPTGSGATGSSPTGSGAAWTGPGSTAAGASGAGAAAGGPAVGGFATGGPECCVCPVCRTIAALRDPSPEFAERLATGAGDFAAGLASLLRALSGPVQPPAEPDDDGAVWRAATRTVHDSGPVPTPEPEQDVWATATRAGDGPPNGDPDRAVPTVGRPDPAGATGATRAAHQAVRRPAVPASRTGEEPVAAVDEGPGEPA